MIFIPLRNVYYSLGYLNDVRKVYPKKGTPYWACRISALTGSSGDIHYVYFDCNIVGDDTKAILKQYQEQACDRNCKVLIGFKLGDMYLDYFTYEKGAKAGQMGVSLKVRLLTVNFIKINVQFVYQNKNTEATAWGNRAVKRETPRQGQQDQGNPSHNSSRTSHMTTIVLR